MLDSNERILEEAKNVIRARTAFSKAIAVEPLNVEEVEVAQKHLQEALSHLYELEVN